MLDVETIFNKVKDHALTLGVFGSVNTHEVTNAPGKGLTAALWIDEVLPVAEASGLDQTTTKITFMFRLYSNMKMEPLDALDPEILVAVDALMGAYTSGFTLDGTIKQVDVLGQHGDSLSARAGYINLEGALYRVMTITVPLIVNDVWEQDE